MLPRSSLLRLWSLNKRCLLCQSNISDVVFPPWSTCSPLCQSIWSSKRFRSRRGASPPSSAAPPGASCAPWLFRYPSPVRTPSRAATGVWNAETSLRNFSQKTDVGEHKLQSFDLDLCSTKRPLLPLWPGLGRPLLLDRPDALPRHRQLGDVDHPHLSAGVAELQSAVPLALHATHHRVGAVLLHLRCHPTLQDTINTLYLLF